MKCDNKALAEALNDEMTKLHKNGQWAKVLQDNKLTDTNDVPLQAPPQLCH